MLLVALAPVARDRLELGSALGAVGDQVGEAGAEAIDARAVVREARARRERERVGFELVEDRETRGLGRVDATLVVGELAAQVEHARLLLAQARDERGQLELVREPEIDVDELQVEDRAHVRVDVGHVDAGVERAVDLRAQLAVDLFGDAVRDGLADGAPHAAIGRDQARYVAAHRSPAVPVVLTVQCQVHAQVELGPRARDPRHLGEARTGDHDAAAGGGGLHGAEPARVRGMRHAEVVHVDDHHAFVGAVAELGK